MSTINHQVRLAARPVGLPKRSDFDFTEEPIRKPGDGEVLVKVVYLSLDPAMRGWMREGRSYIPPVKLGDVMRAGGAGRVIESKHPDFKPGDFVGVTSGVQEYVTVSGTQLTPFDLTLAPATAWLNVLGMPGMTGYFGLLDVGLAKSGETVVVSGAAGAVGQTVGQVARLIGARTIGIAGGAEKCRFVTEDLKYDVAIDYKAQDVGAALREACPNGIDVYFDNVGGEILDAALGRLAMKARIVICGAISQYNATQPTPGPSNYLSLLVNRARMEGMVVFDYAARYPEARAKMGAWLREGAMVSREDVVFGLDTFPETLLMLFDGKNFGKLVLQVASEN
jgi:NADPH-dependent curcumin reductase CurA